MFRSRHRLGWVVAVAFLAVPGAVGAAPKSFNGVPLPHAAQRIVSLSDASTEDLFAIGAGKQVVAADSFSTYPKAAPTTKIQAIDPNAEAIAKYRPDLVVISDNVKNISSQLAALKIPVLYLPAPANLNGAYAQMQQLGAVTGRGAGAARLVRGLRGRVAKLVRSVKHSGPPVTVYHELDQSGYSATSKSFVGQVYSLLGVRNIADAAKGSSAYPQLSREYVVSADPSMIVLADTACCGQSVKTLRARPGFDQIAAVKNHDVLMVNDTVASEWGPRIVDFMAQVAVEVRKVEAQGAR